MSNDISLSGAVRANLQSLKTTSSLLADTQQRLATGKKVNSAIDDPGAFFTSAALNNRANDLSSLLDSVGQAVQTIRAAEHGIGAISDLVESAKGVISQAKETAIKSSSASLSGSFSTRGDANSANTLLGTTGDTTITLTSGGTDSTFNITATNSLDEVATAISALDGYSATVTDSTLTIEKTDGNDFTIAGFAGTSSSLNGTANNGQNRDDFVETFNELRTQIDQIAGDSSYKGVNLLNGDDLTVYFNEDQSSSLDVSGGTLKVADDLSISAGSISGFATDSTLDSLSSELENAETELETRSLKLGTNLSVVETRQDLTGSLINTLKAGANELTAADSNQEGANLLALQTRQQLSSVALSLSAQLDQSVLRLF